MAWTDLTFSYGSLLTSTKMTEMDDNFDALAAGASGAPKIQTAALDSLIVTNAKIANDAVDGTKIDDNVSISVNTLAAGATWTPARGLYSIRTYSGSSAGLPNAAPLPYCVAMQFDTAHPDTLHWNTASYVAGTEVMVWADGTNFRITNSDGSRPAAVIYRKL